MKASSIRELHRTVWTVVRRAPMATIVAPTVAMIGPELIAEYWAAQSGETGFWTELRAYDRAMRWMSIWIQSLTFGIVLSATRRVLSGKSAKLHECHRDAIAVYWRLWRTAFLFNLGTVLTTLLLVIPGLWFAVRSCLCLPAAASGAPGAQFALQDSHALTKGRWWWTLGRLIVPVALYLPLMMLPGFLIAESAPFWLKAVTNLPADIFLHIGVVGLGVLFAVRQTDFRLPAEATHSTGSWRLYFDRPARLAPMIWIAVLGWVLFMGVGLGTYIYSEDLNSQGDEAYAAGDFERAIELYDESLRLFPNDVYALWSKASAQWELGNIRQAIHTIDLAIDADSSDPMLRILKIEMLFELSDLHAAKNTLESLKELPSLPGSGWEDSVAEWEALLSREL